jgi:selenide,water dikinase
MDGEVWAGTVPVLAGTRRLLEQGEAPGGTRSNLAHAAAFTDFPSGMAQEDRLLLADAQTSGGLLAAVPETSVPQLLDQLRRSGDGAAAVVGRVVAPGSGRIRVTPEQS